MSDSGVFVLPGGYVKDGVVYDTVELRGLTGVEEDLLISRNVPFDKKIDTILTNCIKRFSDADGNAITDKNEIAVAVRKITVVDRTYLLVCLRVVSLGEEYTFKVRCPECKTAITQTVILTEKSPIPMPDKKKRTDYEFVLPSGKKVVWDVLTGEKDAEIAKIRTKIEDVPSLYINARVKTIDGKPAILEDIKKLSWADRQALRAEFERVEGYVDTEVNGIVCTNPACMVEFDAVIDLGQTGFFFPEREKRRY